MDIDTLVETFYHTERDTDAFVNEVLGLLITDTIQGSFLTERAEGAASISYDGIPDIPISEIPWSTITTQEGGADIPAPQRQQLMNFLQNIEGDDLPDKVTSLAKFYDTDPLELLNSGFFGKTPKERISKTLSYLTFYKTLTKIIAHFNAASAGFSFESFLGVLLGGVQVPTGQNTIADLLTADDTPISLKLYKHGQLKVGGSFTDLVTDLVRYGKMQYVACTKSLSGEGENVAGTLRFYRFDFTLENIFEILSSAGRDNPYLIQLPEAFIQNPEQFSEIELPPPTPVEQLVELFEDNLRTLAAKFNFEDAIVDRVLSSLAFPDNTTYLKGQSRKFGKSGITSGQGQGVTGHMRAMLVAAGLSDKSDYTSFFNDVLKAANQDVLRKAQAAANARAELIQRAGGRFQPVRSSLEAYDKLNDRLKKRALLVSRGYVYTDQFDLSQPEVLRVQRLGAPREVFPAGQGSVNIGELEIGRANIERVMSAVSQIIDDSVFAIFADLKVLTTSIQSYFAGGLQNDGEATQAIAASDSIGSRTEELSKN